MDPTMDDDTSSSDCSAELLNKDVTEHTVTFDASAELASFDKFSLDMENSTSADGLISETNYEEEKIRVSKPKRPITAKTIKVRMRFILRVFACL